MRRLKLVRLLINGGIYTFNTCLLILNKLKIFDGKTVSFKTSGAFYPKPYYAIIIGRSHEPSQSPSTDKNFACVILPPRETRYFSRISIALNIASDLLACTSGAPSVNPFVSMRENDPTCGLKLWVGGDKN